MGHIFWKLSSSSPTLGSITDFRVGVPLFNLQSQETIPLQKYLCCLSNYLEKRPLQLYVPRGWGTSCHHFYIGIYLMGEVDFQNGLDGWKWSVNGSMSPLVKITLKPFLLQQIIKWMTVPAPIFGNLGELQSQNLWMYAAAIPLKVFVTPILQTN